LSYENSMVLDAPIEVHQRLRKLAIEIRENYPAASEDRLELCRKLLENTNLKLRPSQVSFDIERLPKSIRYYFISSLYMLLMPPKRRQRLSAYFTPPFLCEHVISRALAFGYNPTHHTVLDPACGGAAFLVPLAQQIVAKGKQDGLTPKQLAELLGTRLFGIEIEPGLAALSELLISDVLGSELNRKLSRNLRIVKRQNALKLGDDTGPFDFVVSNPPYGRVFRAGSPLLARWEDVITDGHVNTYALFVSLALQRTKINGLVALVIPTSFLAGPYFSKLRSHIRSVSNIIQIDIIEKRADVFMDVTQDTCVIFLRRTLAPKDVASPPKVSRIGPAGLTEEQGYLQLSPALEGALVLPIIADHSLLCASDKYFFNDRFSTLKDLGYGVRSGYFVWNRSQDRLTIRDEPIDGEFPLIWAQDVKANSKIVLSGRNNPRIDQKSGLSCVRLMVNSSAILKTPSLVLQRTTNNHQFRRLIAGKVDIEIIDRYDGFLTENHTIVIHPLEAENQYISIDNLMTLINSAPVNDLYRSISGTASVSVKTLRQLPLPNHIYINKYFESFTDSDIAVSKAYQATAK
jgi:adenine-specific DNA-methyltransferase